jgi:hypothetical protein
MLFIVILIMEACAVQIFRKEPFFYGHDNYDQLVKIAKVCVVFFRSLDIFFDFFFIQVIGPNERGKGRFNLIASTS